MSEGTIKKEILDFYASESYANIRTYYSRRNIFGILGKSRDEVTHSNFLAWLLTSNESHSLGTLPMMYLLRLLNFSATQRRNQTSFLPDYVEDLLLTSKTKLTEVTVTREQAISPDKNTFPRRLDLFCKVTLSSEEEYKIFYVAIENKIGSSETIIRGVGQTESYYEWLEKKYGAGNVIYVYLTPKTSIALDELARQDCRCDKFIQINYQELLDYTIQPCTLENMPTDAKFLIEDYIRCLEDSPLYVSESTGGIWKMASSEKERELLTKFWLENEQLIRAAMDVVFENVDEETQQKIKEAERNYSENARQKHQYVLDGNVYSSMTKLVVAVVSSYVTNHPDVTYEELKKAFPDEWGTPGFGVVIEDLDGEIAQNRLEAYRTGSDVQWRYHTNGKKPYEGAILLKDGTKVVVSNQWAFEGNFQSFLAGVSSLDNGGINIDVK